MKSGLGSRRGGSEALASLMLFTVLIASTFMAYSYAINTLRRNVDLAEAVLRLHEAVVEVAYRPGSSRLVKLCVPEGCRIEFRGNSMIVYGLRGDLIPLLRRTGKGVLLGARLREDGVLLVFYDAGFNDYTVTSGYHSIIVVSGGFGKVIITERWRKG